MLQETSDLGITESSIAGRWSDQDGVCQYFLNYSLVCNLSSGAPPIERRWSHNGDLLEWHGGAKRYVYRVVDLTQQHNDLGKRVTRIRARHALGRDAGELSSRLVSKSNGYGARLVRAGQ